MKEKEFSIYLTEVLSEMCSRAGISFNDVDWNDDDWYMKHVWSLEDQNSFKNWLVNYWYENNKARREMTHIYNKRKRDLKKAADMFVFMYGWKFS